MGVLVPGGDRTAVKRTADFFLAQFTERLEAQVGGGRAWWLAWGAGATAGRPSVLLTRHTLAGTPAAAEAGGGGQQGLCQELQGPAHQG